MENLTLKDYNNVIGDVINPYQQSYDDTCAIKSQQLILEKFGIYLSEEQLVQYSIEQGWYDCSGNGTKMTDVGKLLVDAGIPCTQTTGANVYDLANELAQGHKVIVGVDSGELWDNNILDWLKDFFLGDTPDHALIVAGIDLTDPNNPMVIVTDPGSGQPAQPYPLDQFMDAWSDSNCFMVSTDIATFDDMLHFKDYGFNDCHIDNIAGNNYDTLVQFQNYSHQIDYAAIGSSLYDMFNNFPSMNMTFDGALLHFNMPPFDPSLIMVSNYINPSMFNYMELQNLSWIDPAFNMQPITDIFGVTRFVNPMDVDIMSGIPSWEFDHSMADAMHEQNRAKLDKSYTIEQERDLAVENYHRAQDCGDYDEMIKWQNIANSHQQDLYNLWDTPQYGLPAVAPGID